MMMLLSLCFPRKTTCLAVGSIFYTVLSIVSLRGHIVRDLNRNEPLTQIINKLELTSREVAMKSVLFSFSAPSGNMFRFLLRAIRGNFGVRDYLANEGRGVISGRNSALPLHNVVIKRYKLTGLGINPVTQTIYLFYN